MPCCCDTTPPPANCVQQGPCRTCVACDTEAYPANQLVQAAAGCGGDAFMLQGITLPNGFDCICAYGCVFQAGPDGYSAGLTIRPQPGGIKHATLIISDYRGPIDLDIAYTNSNWNCCGTNIMTLADHNCDAPPAATRTVLPTPFPCTCTHPGPWCRRRVVTMQCLVRNMVNYSFFNDRVVNCPWFPAAGMWEGSTVFDDGFDIYRLELNLSCGGLLLGEPTRWISGAEVFVNSNLVAAGSDSTGTNTCNPVFRDSSFSLPGTEPDVIRTTWTEP